MTGLPCRWKCRLLTTSARRHAASELMHAYMGNHDHSNVNHVVPAWIQTDTFRVRVAAATAVTTGDLIAVVVHCAACLLATA